MGNYDLMDIFANIHLCINDEIVIPSNPVLRVEVDSFHNNKKKLENLGLHMVDRTIGVKVPLKQLPDLSRNIRFAVEELENSNVGVAKVGYISLTHDFRFNVSSDKQLRDKLIDKYLGECQRIFVIQSKGESIGFMGMIEQDNSVPVPFIHLAAVHPDYQAAGVSMALYSYAMMRYRDEEFKNIYGRISSSNMPVMNLYSSLGSKFYEPRDINIRRG